MQRGGILNPYKFMAGFNRERFIFVLDRSGMTQMEIEEASGVDQSAISQIRSGRTKEPSASTIFKIADAVGVSCDTFRQEVDAPIRWLPGRKPKAKD